MLLGFSQGKSSEPHNIVVINTLDKVKSRYEIILFSIKVTCKTNDSNSICSNNVHQLYQTADDFLSREAKIPIATFKISGVTCIQYM